MPSSVPFPIALNTTIALIDQFSISLSQQPQPSPKITNLSGAPLPPSSPSPLPLLSAAVASLKAQVTKLSLLAITAPFTPSAVAAILSTLNDSVLPSLVTAALLVTADGFTAAYHKEISRATKTVLKDLKSLLEEISRRGQSSDKVPDIASEEKKLVTELTGKVWEGCDELAKLADGGAAVFIAAKASEFLELVKDAVKELEEWEPEVDDENDDIFEESEDSDDDCSDSANQEGEEAELQAHKEDALNVLRRIPMCMHVVLKYRLQKSTWDESNSRQAQLLDELLSKYKLISETVDEAVGTLQDGDTDACKRNTSSSQRATLGLVEMLLSAGALLPVRGNVAVPDVTKEDRYVLKARDWIQAVGDGNPMPHTHNDT